MVCQYAIMSISIIRSLIRNPENAIWRRSAAVRDGIAMHVAQGWFREDGWFISMTAARARGFPTQATTGSAASLKEQEAGLSGTSLRMVSRPQLPATRSYRVTMSSS